MIEKTLVTTSEELVSILKRQRKKKKISQAELGGFANLTTATISKIESSTSDPQLTTFMRLAQLLNLKIYIEET
ncbi:MAG: helix-turn-helix transcriptional regulator [Bdellovibrio sp.]